MRRALLLALPLLALAAACTAPPVTAADSRTDLCLLAVVKALKAHEHRELPRLAATGTGGPRFTNGLGPEKDTATLDQACAYLIEAP